MKLISTKIILGAILLLTGINAQALPLGNPADPALYTRGVIVDGLLDGCGNGDCNSCGFNCFDFFNFRTGYYGDFVFKSHLERTNDSDIDHASFYTNAGLLVFNFCQRVDLFVTLGATTSNIKTQSEAQLAFVEQFSTFPRVEFDFGSDFSWSVGARAILWQCGCTYLGLEGQYFRTHQHLNRVTVGALFSDYPDDSVETKYHEWQVGLGLAHRINWFVPYIGVKWSKAHTHATPGAPFLGNSLQDLRSQHHWGFAAGFTIVACDAAGVTVEGRWGNEKALHVNGQIRF